ncbi:ribonuclease HII [Chamaesiphon sp.]|uniref:ribonuclease HII n=1 Tax=Chamaesiphon sp. TaxID=2814140 RepID=UPI00359448CD
MTSHEFTCAQQLIAGVDEVGRGALFGVVVAAAVILPKELIGDCQQWGIKDSKKLSAHRREILVPQIQQAAIAYQIGIATIAEIDELNILQASLLAMRRAILGLVVTPELCLVDGNKSIPNLDLPQQTLVKGEDKSVAIAAASILAKVWRDRLMSDRALIYPHYDLAQNKGYGTARHLSAIDRHGITPEHRQSFSPCTSPRSSLSSLSVDED